MWCDQGTGSNGWVWREVKPALCKIKHLPAVWDQSRQEFGFICTSKAAAPSKDLPLKKDPFIDIVNCTYFLNAKNIYFLLCRVKINHLKEP
jgi:hypothetical protein